MTEWRTAAVPSAPITGGSPPSPPSVCLTDWVQSANRLFLVRAIKRHVAEATFAEAENGRIALNLVASNPTAFDVVLLVSQRGR